MAGGLQARMSESDPRLYDPNRDVAHNFGFVAEEAARRLEDQQWPFLRYYCMAHQVTPDELGEACRAFLEFVATSTDSAEEKRPAQALVRVGWYAVREEAQFAFLALFSTVMLGIYYGGVRAAVHGQEDPTDNYKHLLTMGRRTSVAVTLPYWRRRIEVLKYRGRLWLLKRLGANPVASPLLSHMDYDAQRRAVEERARRQRAMSAMRREDSGGPVDRP